MFTRSFDEFSPCRRARYVMGHIWDDALPALLSVALNPSIGSADKNDPTNERLERRARMLGFGGVIFVNLFPLIATSPFDMLTAEDPFIDRCRADSVILEHAKGNFILCGWGNHGTHLNRAEEVIQMLLACGCVLHALSITNNGQPQHPLYISYQKKPFLWKGRLMK